MYGTQAQTQLDNLKGEFENDVKMYGTQAISLIQISETKCEKDV